MQEEFNDDDFVVRKKPLDFTVASKRSKDAFGNMNHVFSGSPTKYTQLPSLHPVSDEQSTKTKPVKETNTTNVLFHVIDYTKNNRKPKELRRYQEVHSLNERTLDNEDNFIHEIRTIFQTQPQNLSTKYIAKLSFYITVNGLTEWVPKQDAFLYPFSSDLKQHILIVNSFLNCNASFTKKCSIQQINDKNLYITFLTIENGCFTSLVKCLFTFSTKDDLNDIKTLFSFYFLFIVNKLVMTNDHSVV
ncbi:Uncharacterized protein QTN25_001679 [Entamoeba marina]